MQRISFLAIFLLTTSLVFAQTAFQKTLDLAQDDEFLCGIPTADGGYLAAGYSTGVPFGGLAVKMNSLGTVQWARTVGGSRIVQAAETGWGAFYMAGVNTISSNTNFYLTKVDPNGNVLWSKTYGKTSEPDELRSLAVTPDGGLLLSGYADTVNGAGFRPIAYVVKTDSNGVLQWSRYIGGGNGEEFYAAKPVSGGGYLCCGYTGSYGSPVGTESYAVKLDSAGTIVWAKVFGHSNRFDRIYDFTEDPGVGFYVTGQGLYSATTDNLFIAKLDTAGNFIWQKNLQEYNGGLSIVLTQDHQLVVGGYFISQSLGLYNDSYLLKADTSGNVIWSLELGAPNVDDKLYSVKETPDAGFFITGSTYNTGNARSSWYLKTDAAGHSGCRDSVVTIPVTTLVIATTSGGNAAPVFYFANSSAAQLNAVMTPVVFCQGPTGVEEETLADFAVYPNPANGSFTIDVPKAGTFSIRIFDSYGKLIASHENVSGKTEFHSENWPAGLYVVKVEGADFVAAKKLLLN